MVSAGQLKIQPIILCGGTGTRLWPLSRTGFPKQFLCLTGRESLFQLAVRRLDGLSAGDIFVNCPLIVTNEEQRFLVLEQLRETGVTLGAALLEPVGRNTAPAVTFAALAALESDTDPVLVVTPSDQTMADESAFTDSMQTAIREASSGNIVILGVTPDQPATGYGYINVGMVSEAESGSAALPVHRFVEKPDQSTAEKYLKDGGYFWNAGIFVLKASVWMAAIQKFRPDIAEATQKAWVTRQLDAKAGFVRPGKDEFVAIPSESVDYAVMEPLAYKGDQILKMIPLNAGWNDLGAWDAVWSVMDKDHNGNARNGDVLTTDSKNNLVYASSRLVSLVGVKNLVVIETADAVLVADKSSSQDVKQVVHELQQQKREEHNLHRKVHRPWGWYDSIDEGGRFKVKRIQVNPKASLSLQMHHHRAEHWIVVTGTAEITCGEKVMLLTENQSTYIPLGAIHRLANPGTIPLEIIEVQSGSFLCEDDIVRFEDNYGRLR